MLVDSLPFYANLRRWGGKYFPISSSSSSSVLCITNLKRCDMPCSCHAAATEQLRFNLRHDSILLHIVKQVRASKQHSGKRIIADVPGFQLPDGGTIPPEILVTGMKPDIVLIEEKTNSVELLSLQAALTVRRTSKVLKIGNR